MEKVALIEKNSTIVLVHAGRCLRPLGFVREVTFTHQVPCANRCLCATLSKPISDHIPYVLHTRTTIPKSNMFRFENFWVDHPGFAETVSLHWNSSPFYANAAKHLSSKFKQVRTGLRAWSKSLSNLSKLIFNCN